MTIFKSRQVNLDPEPWACPYEGRHAGAALCSECYLRPRPEFEPTRDPYPWLCDYEIDGQPVRSFFDGHGRYAWAPRRKQFDTPVNRVLVAFRDDQIQADDRSVAAYWLRNISYIGHWFSATFEEIDHARRVLTRLANWKEQ